MNKTMLLAALLIATLLSACSSPSALDEAYSSGGTFGGNPYTRSIFSSSNF